MQIDYFHELDINFLAAAVDVYFESLKEKLEPILGSDGRGKRVLAESLAMDQCIVAVQGDQVVGILGFQSKQGSFFNPTLRTLIKTYGLISGLVRLAGLITLHHPIESNELYIDGIVVHPDYRGLGIGTRLIEMVETKASKEAIKKLSLEVIDTNPKAESLYERLGFKAVKKQSIWPLKPFIRFPFNSSTTMEKTIC